MAFPLHASEISDKSKTGREKYVSVPAESSHFFPFKKVLYRRGQNVTFFGKDVTKNVTSSKKYFRVRERHILPRNATNVTRQIFFVTEKRDMCDVTHPNLRQDAGKKSGQDRPYIMQELSSTTTCRVRLIVWQKDMVWSSCEIHEHSQNVKERSKLSWRHGKSMLMTGAWTWSFTAYLHRIVLRQARNGAKMHECSMGSWVPDQLSWMKNRSRSNVKRRQIWTRYHNTAYEWRRQRKLQSFKDLYKRI